MTVFAVAYNEKGQGIYFHDLKEEEEINWEDYTIKHITKNNNLLLFKEGTEISTKEVDDLRKTLDKIVLSHNPK